MTIAGKWMIMFGKCNPDKMWQAIARGLLDGSFPEGILSAKMNLHDDRGKSNEVVKINVYTKDFSNKREVREAETAIIERLKRCCTVVEFESIQTMKYKAELYTHVNIFMNNKFGGEGIPPSLYTSTHVGRGSGNSNFGRGSYSFRSRGGRGAARGRPRY